MKIAKVTGRKILDSTGSWTVRATVELKNDIRAAASVPAGVSTSPFETENVPVDCALETINESINKALKGKDPSHQQSIDKILREFEGANTRLPVSLAVCKTAALSKRVSLYQYIRTLIGGRPSRLRLPKLMVLLFEGGQHGSGNLVSQEFMAVAGTLNEGIKIYQTVSDHLRKEGQSLSVGLEGGFTPDYEDTEALKVLNYILNGSPLALDVAFESHYIPDLNYQYFIGDLNLVSIEDHFGVDEWELWSEFNRGWGREILVVADDLVATNPERLKKAIELQAANAVVIKPNQIGTVSQTLEVVQIAKEAFFRVIVSHRGRETNDDFIADLAVGVEADYVKFGGLARGERIAKYNRLLDIQQELSHHD